jgi:hypothetical protein
MPAESAKDDRPKKKKKKPKSNSGMLLWLAIGGGALVLLLLIGGGVLIAWAPWSRGANKQNVAQNPQPKEKDPEVNVPIGGNVVKEPKSLLGTVRHRGDRASRDNEMRQIVLFYHQYCDTFTNANSRSVDGFLDFIKRDSPKIVNEFKEKYYTLNPKARPNGDSIVVYETEMYTNGYYVFRANNQFGFVSAQELKAGLQ